MVQYKGSSRKHEVKASRRRKDTRLLGQRLRDYFESGNGVVAGIFALPVIGLVLIKVPMSGELLLLLAWIYYRKYVRTENRAFDFPYRVPVLAKVKDGSTKGGKEFGKGVTLIGNDLETKEQIYAGDSDLRTHALVLGTTGSGKPQPLHAHVLTPSGWATMGELSVGNKVCTPDGETAEILNIYEQGIKETFHLHIKNDKKAEATGDHLWRVLICYPNDEEEIKTLTTDEIYTLLQTNINVMLLQVKTEKNKATVKAHFHHWEPIVKITPAGKHPCRCIEIDHPQHLYITDNDLVTHNTEFLLGLVFNALVQNTGFIYVDGKGDPKLQKEIFRLSRYLGREDDLLIINFITSGRDFIEKQVDKVTNNMNIMGNTSSGMLIELIVSLMDDSGGKGGDMWKGRAISFVAALTRPLTYLRDKGYINLSPEKYLEYFELNVIEELVWEHNGKYGEMFDVIVAPLRSYLITLPGYQKSKIKMQETKTLEQHGYIVMQLTRIFNDLTFNYGHIFKTKVGDVDFYDVVINRRLLVVLLPALERAPDSMRMLGKMIVGSIKQMMAGCLGNRVEGVVREIIDSRPTNASFPFYTILDEYGYYAVVGFAVAPAQARSLGFSVIFAAQDFSSLKKSSAEEADATWENTNIRAIGRITSGKRSDTWERIQGASGEVSEAVISGFDRRSGTVSEAFKQQQSVSIERRERLDYDDLAMQENGEFTFLIGKKERNGQSGGVGVIRGMGFYTAGPAPKEMRINDLIPVESPEPADLPQNKKAIEVLMKSLNDNSFSTIVLDIVKGDPILATMHREFEQHSNMSDSTNLSQADLSSAILGWFISGKSQKTSTNKYTESNDASLQQAIAEKALLDTAALILSQPKQTFVHENTEAPVIAQTDLVVTGDNRDNFQNQTLPIIRQHLSFMGDMPPEDKWESEIVIADKQALLDLDVIAAGQPFSHLEQKWDAEDRIAEMRHFISVETSYTESLKPEPLDSVAMRNKLDQLSSSCQQVIKN